MPVHTVALAGVAVTIAVLAIAMSWLSRIVRLTIRGERFSVAAMSWIVDAPPLSILRRQPHARPMALGSDAKPIL